MTGRSSDGHPGRHRRHGTQLRTVRADGTPVYRYQPRPGMPPIGVVRFDDDHLADGPAGHRHAHDFLVLIFIESGDGEARIDGRQQILGPGDVYAVPAGQVLGSGTPTAISRCSAWAVFFTADAVIGGDAGSPLHWSRHPLLSLFAPGRSPAAGILTVPAALRADWSRWYADLQAELAEPGRLGAAQATIATLTRLLVAASRLDPNPSGAAPIDPLVTRVFEVIEARYAEPISTRDVADELGYTAGHLTTMIRERTGRTVLDWITERRMGEVRRLLAETDLSVRAIATRTGHRDGEYLTRRFRDRYGSTPLQWRQAMIRRPDR
ncbi:AraC family transcriptional regulator [Microlunatus soli]|uniref:AraC-type DNA-binding protein n=1 Tax=Microlunatus soli TaxID=630515 RepID=A0A1H1Y6S9_9ACTN|nr:AraC family transcriptional regulator [Microlunatus soli]SDT17218.1 AraC-type DNA-binding protein [Microlunatus soli]